MVFTSNNRTAVLSNLKLAMKNLKHLHSSFSSIVKLVSNADERNPNLEKNRDKPNTIKIFKTEKLDKMSLDLSGILKSKRKKS